MRVRTDEKKHEILHAAGELFRELGLTGVSMAAIAGRLGISKATLYGYFSSKEELFAEAMVFIVRDRGEEMLSTLNSDEDVRLVLRRFARAYLPFATQPDIIAHARVAIGDGPRSELGPMLYRLGQRRALGAIEGYLTRATAAGMLNCPDVAIAAQHLKGMLEAGTVIPMLYGTKPQQPFDTLADAAVDAFIKIYGKS
ncbi:TetR/AcrR family transcriptional regulator [Martelella alba]|uniref:TetR/AcrR family transcriptional regulator n=1 Tax=Martelella alba TaxID=2590451 RepID=UPI0015E83681|nr:TetR/AcrR family transcriptional regulator [Martelella alba]